jgi:hypothetical protein
MLIIRNLPGAPDHGQVIERISDHYRGEKLVDDWSPDLSDPATIGCLYSLVREAWSEPEMHMTLGGAGWVWLSGESRVATVILDIPAGKTEAEAITLALEAAP